MVRDKWNWNIRIAPRISAIFIFFADKYVYSSNSALSVHKDYLITKYKYNSIRYLKGHIHTYLITSERCIPPRRQQETLVDKDGRWGGIRRSNRRQGINCRAMVAFATVGRKWGSNKQLPMPVSALYYLYYISMYIVKCIEVGRKVIVNY